MTTRHGPHQRKDFFVALILSAAYEYEVTNRKVCADDIFLLVAVLYLSRSISSHTLLYITMHVAKAILQLVNLQQLHCPVFLDYALPGSFLQ